jgi:acyl-CoA thioester hydrolase
MHEFNYKLKVFYEDTDAGGVVYYANYLKFFERARTDAISNIGLSNKKLLDEYGVFIIVKSCNVEYLKPAKLEDQLEIKSSIISTSNTSFKMKQKAFRDQELITDCEIHLVIVDKSGRPTKIPDILKEKIIIN